MTVGRYLLLVEPTAERAAQVRGATRALAGYSLLHDDPRLTVLVDAACGLLQTGPTSWLLGRAFARSGSTGARALAASTGGQCSLSRKEIVRDLWGDFVFVGNEPGSDRLVVGRPPFGGMPFLFSLDGGGLLGFSDLALLSELGLAAPKVDVGGLARFLRDPDARYAFTCLAGVEELRGGTRLEVGGGSVEVAEDWSPWSFTVGTGVGEDREEAAQRVRRAGMESIAASSSQARKVLLLLSGGLDSSVLAACLSHAGCEFECVNFASGNPTSDERGFARSVARRFAVPLHELSFDIRNVDLFRCAAPASARPAARGFERDVDLQVASLAAEVGADLVVDGGGGDNVFCALQSVAPVADAVRTRSWCEYWSTSRDVALITGASVPAIAWRALARSRRRPPRVRREPDARLLSPEAAGLGGRTPIHPWRDPPDEVLPGSAAHVDLLVAAQGVAEDGLDRPGGRRSPLLSPPLVETCISIPGRFWMREGRSRAVAREAFAADLPPEIVRRSSKGSPGSFMAEVFRRRRDDLRNLLLGGFLATHGLIDEISVSSQLDEGRVAADFDFTRVLQLADAEVWARGW